MNIKKSLTALLLGTAAMISLQALAGNVSPTDARLTAKNYFNQYVAKSSGTLRAPALADLTLVHTEGSAIAGINDYYAFNVTGGGFIIVAGEDRAVPVLGYSDHGRIDFNNLPAPLKDLLDGYKAEIEFLRSYDGDDLVPHYLFLLHHRYDVAYRQDHSTHLPYFRILIDVYGHSTVWGIAHRYASYS